MNEPGYPSSPLPPSSIPLQPCPMTFGQILDRIYRLMRAHFRLFFGIAAVPSAAISLLIAAMVGVTLKMFASQMTGVHAAPPPPLPPGFLMWVLIGEALSILVFVLYTPAAVYAALQADQGVAVSFRQAYHVALSRFGRYLWLMILWFLYLVVPVAVLGALIGAGILLLRHMAGIGEGPASAYFLVPLIVLLYLCIFVYSIYIMLRFAAAYPASVEENLPAWASLRRSAELTRGAKGRIFLVMLVVYAITYAVELVSILVLFALGALVALGAMMEHVTKGTPAFFILIGLGVLGYLLVILATMLFCNASFTTALAVIYRDQRLRKDGLATAAIESS